MTDSVTVKGASELAASSKHAADDLADMQTENSAAGQLVETRARGHAPKVSGTLAASVSADATATEVVIASDVVYAPRVNYGMPSVSQPAQPFMTDALAEGQQAILDLYGRSVNTSIAKVHGT